MGELTFAGKISPMGEQIFPAGRVDPGFLAICWEMGNGNQKNAANLAPKGPEFGAVFGRKDSTILQVWKQSITN